MTLATIKILDIIGKAIAVLLVVLVVVIIDMVLDLHRKDEDK